jgi:hypothetical protein
MSMGLQKVTIHQGITTLKLLNNKEDCLYL